MELTMADYRNYEPTVEDLLAIQEFWDECAAVQANQARARQIAETDTRDESAPATAHVLFPIWNAETPMHDALAQLAHLEVA